jgi:HD superfamily phosphohydrolase
MKIPDQINDILHDSYGELPIYNVSSPKFIHLTHIGTHNFKPHEIAIIDTPIIQRLRFISQLGPSHYVFPTARHSRFEHTLGVMIRVNQMYSTLLENQKLKKISNTTKEKVLNELRLAGLLHDIGHGPFSHVCETVMLESKSLDNEKEKLHCKCHEALGYHIIRSDFMEPFFDKIRDSYHISIDSDEISKMIIGQVKNPKEDQYKADLINGEFDADKLDYIIRDSYFSGVQLALGTDRFLLALGVDTIDCYDGKKKKLILSEKGIMPMEQIIIAKIMLTGAIYHHQKVRAIDSMIIALLRKVLERKPTINGHKIKNALDFLRLDDNDLFRLKSNDKKITELCKALKNRETYKRALVISPKTVRLNEDGTDSANFWDMLEYAENPKELRKLSIELAERIGNGCTEYDVAIDIPKPPEIKETLQKVIKIYDHFVTIKDIFPQKGWIDAYIANKWMGYIFSNVKYRAEAFSEGKKFLEEKFEIKFNDNAEKFAKMEPLYKIQRESSDF